MKTLLVLRHAKASRESPTGGDFDRPLAERGWADGRLIGREMRHRGLHPDAVVASPATRVVETLAAVAEGYGPLDATFDKSIYDSTPELLLGIVRESDEEAQRLMLIGHNPGLQELLLRLTVDDSDGLRVDVAGKFPTAAIAAVELPIDEWRNLLAGTGRITSLIRPGDL